MKKKTLAEENPELAKQWHPAKNGNLKPTDVTAHSGKKVWWLYSYDDPETGKHLDFEWEAKVADRAKAPGCPFLNGCAVWPGFNDLASKNEELAKQWHPTKNGELKPTDITLHSMKKVWWLYPYDDPETGKHFDFEWKAMVGNRAKAPGCPFLNGCAVWPGFNDLASKNEELAKQWHPTKNGKLKPTDVTSYCRKKVWWLYPYDEPETGKHFEFEWNATVKSRSNGMGCPFLSRKAAWPGFNDLASKNEELAKQWHPTKNGELKPTDVTPYSSKKVWWLYPYDDPETGKHFVFEWQATVSSRSYGIGCPFLSGKSAWPGFNDLASKNEELAKQWHPTKNGRLKPTNITLNSRKKVWWYLPYDDPETGKHFDFEWKAMVGNRAKAPGCPFLNGCAVWPGFNDLASKNEELAKQWHPTKNGELKPTDVTSYSSKKVWWLYPYDDPETGKHFEFEWKATVNDRANGVGCPFLSGCAVWPGFNDLASQHPELAKEFHPTKNRKRMADQVRMNASKKYWWLCSMCGCSWRASVRSIVTDDAKCRNCEKRKKIE